MTTRTRRGGPAECYFCDHWSNTPKEWWIHHRNCWVGFSRKDNNDAKNEGDGVAAPRLVHNGNEQKKTFADAQRLVASMVPRAQANYHDASRSRDSEWEREAGAELMMLYSVCQRLGFNYEFVNE
jgi:hypothetical protein